MESNQVIILSGIIFSLLLVGTIVILFVASILIYRVIGLLKKKLVEEINLYACDRVADNLAANQGIKVLERKDAQSEEKKIIEELDKELKKELDIDL